MFRALRIAAVVWIVAAVALALKSPDEAVLLLHSRIAPLNAPPPGLGEQDDRILPAVAATNAGGHSFMNTREDGSPVTFSPCRPWYVVVNPRGGPPGALRKVSRALAVMEAATGLRLVLEGRSDERGDADRPYHQPSRYGDRWAPILVAWVDATEERNAGKGGPALAHRWFGEPAYVSGTVLLNRRGMEQRPAAVSRAVLLHELGHVVGLAHSTDPTSMMYPFTRGQAGFSAQDLAGLARLGRGECSRAY